MLRICCINAGNYQGMGARYVNLLREMVARNLPDGFAGEFVCFTDDITDIHPSIICRPLPREGLKGWWNKLALFAADVFPAGDRVVYFDLDTLITGPLDEIVAYDGKFAILRDFYRPNGLQSSVMAWEAGTLDFLWDNWESCGFLEPEGGDQAWIESQMFGSFTEESHDLWQDLFPGKFFSFKVDGRFDIPKGASVCVFHGEPRPHEVTEGWVPQVWKLGGGTSAEMVVQANVSRETIKSNILSAKQRNAQWLRLCEPHDGEALICAGGPSLKDDLPSIKAHIAQGAKVYAVNNALAFAAFNGIIPDAHVILDARPENIAFVPVNHPAERIYASQCDPSVLDAAGPNLTLWHPYFDGILEITGSEDQSAYVGGGSTAGLKAVVIAYGRGFRKIHLYGFDSSYRGDQNHAYPQPLNDGERIVDVTLPNGQAFKCAPWMVTQAEDFQELAKELTALGCELYVHGDGLLPAMAALATPSQDAAEERAQAILERIGHIQFPRGAEIRVFHGDLSKRLLARHPGLTLYMVDSWGVDHAPQYAESGDFHAKLTQEQQDESFEYASAMTAFAGARAQIIRKPSIDAALDVPRESLDFVFIDADHSYEGCAMDISVWLSRIKPGGILCGHDYENTEFPKFGVKRAVDEFVQAASLEISLGANYTWFVVKPVREAKAA